VRYLKYLILAPIVVLMLAFAYANRMWVTVSFNPLASADLPSALVPAPIYAVVFVSIMIGVIVGGSSTWFSQGRHRRALRHAKAELERLRSELQAKRTPTDSPGADARRA